MIVALKRFLVLINILIVVAAVSCRTHRGVTRYNTTRQMYKHPTLQKIPRAKSSKEQRYHRIGRRDKVMNKSK